METATARELERYRRQLLTTSQARQLSKNHYEIHGDYEEFLLSLYGRGAVPSGATCNPEDPIERAVGSEADKRVRLEIVLGIKSGEELVSIAVRKDDGSIDTRPA